MNKASCLSLLSNAVLVWNSLRIGEIVDQLRAAGHAIADQDLARVSPLMQGHVIPTGHTVLVMKRNHDLSTPPQAKPLRYRAIAYYRMYIHSALRMGRREDRRNQRKHGGISFELATLVFEDERCLVYMDRIEEDEHGEEIIRIISAREAEERDIRRYQAQALDES